MSVTQSPPYFYRKSRYTRLICGSNVIFRRIHTKKIMGRVKAKRLLQSSVKVSVKVYCNANCFFLDSSHWCNRNI